MAEGLGTLKGWLAILFALLLVTGGLGVSEVTLDASYNGNQKEITRGQILVVALESNPSTGYRWQVLDVDKNILQQTGESVFQISDSRNPPPPGASGTETFRFEAVGAGTTNLMLAYRRPGDKGVQPLKLITVQVIVH